MYLVKYICRLGVRDNCKRVSWWILSIYYKLKLKSNISELSPKYLELSEGNAADLSIFPSPQSHHRSQSSTDDQLLKPDSFHS